MTSNKKNKIVSTIKVAFPSTIPVLTGYVFLGIAFGILLAEAGYNTLWALGMSVFIYAGSAQILCVSLLANQAALWQVAILIFLLNFRHLINIPIKGIDFVMTALFAVLVVEQWKNNKKHLPAFIGFGVTIVALIFLGPDNFLIPALIVVSGILLILQKNKHVI